MIPTDPADTRLQPSSRRIGEPACVSIVIPAYNEAGALAATLDMIAGHLSALTPAFELVVVDDGSRDATARIACDCAARLPVTLVRFSRNFGKEAAISAGLQYARGDVVVCMDADGQHSAELLGDMLARWRDGYDMVYAVRADRGEQGLFNRLGSRVFYGLMNMGGRLDIPPNAGDFRLMDRCVVDALLALPERQRFMKGMYAWVGFRSIGIPYTPLPRSAGITTFNRLNLMRLAWTGLTSFSVLPLRMASLTGLLLSTLAFAYGLYEVIEKLVFGIDLPGWPTVVVSIMFFSGVQLLFIGILGEYLARVYEEVKGRPPYVVAELVRREPVPQADRIED